MDRAAIAFSYNMLAAKFGWPVYCDPALSFQSADLVALNHVLDAAKGEQDFLKRSALTVRLMKAHATYMTIYEKVEGRWRVRLMGTNFARAYNDLTGKFIDDAVEPDRVARFLATLDHALRADGPQRFLAQADVIDKDYLTGEYLVSPLANEAGEPTMVLSRVHFFQASDWPHFLAGELQRIRRDAA